MSFFFKQKYKEFLTVRLQYVLVPLGVRASRLVHLRRTLCTVVSPLNVAHSFVTDCQRPI